ncbi:fibronectin type III domain-containing protein [Lacrimispora aerotolerans]|uniref:fibronectin type III domain-containing protein n=1 Tax=Lacrimispora aerotolerans TaxID=36832 RepID=UPI00047DEADC|nr:Ig-like domain-containing protein [Lacrimispora aerotolerans]
MKLLKNKFFGMLLLSVLFVITFGSTITFAATVGSKLTTPEAGWSRYDPAGQSNIHMTGTWGFLANDSRLWGGTSQPTSDKNATCRFKFYGTKLRIIGWYDTNRPTQVNVTIDGNTNSYNPYNSKSPQVIVYEKTGLDLKVHEVVINSPYVGSTCYDVDAIDIDATGYLVDYNLPMNLTGSEVDSRAVLKWDAVDGATSYNIKIATTSGGPYTSNYTTTDSTYSDQAVNAGKTYYYVVSAIVNGVESPNSNEISVTIQNAPTSPFNLTAAATDSTVSLNWDAINGATSYNVKWSTSPSGVFTTLNTTNTTGYTDTNIKAGDTRYYVVSAIINGVESSNSNEVSVTIPQADPLLLSVLLNTGETVQLSTSYNLDNNSNYTWSSTNESVATVDNKGKVTAVTEGTTNIYAKSEDGTFMDYIPVKVVKNADKLRLAVHLKQNEKTKLYLTDNAGNVTWKSLDNSIAAISADGEVTGVNKGLAIVQAVLNGKIYHIYVRVDN